MEIEVIESLDSVVGRSGGMNGNELSVLRLSLNALVGFPNQAVLKKTGRNPITSRLTDVQLNDYVASSANFKPQLYMKIRESGVDLF